MSRNKLTESPPSLASLFPELKTMEEKAFRFLEVKYEQKTYRRTGEKLGLHHNTVKNVYEFLMDTDVYYRFQEVVADQIESFFTEQNLTNVFETYQADVKRLEALISEQLARGSDASKEMALKFMREKRLHLKDILATSLACRGHKIVDRDGKTPVNVPYYQQHEDVMEEALALDGDEDGDEH